jgi:hypothetical protein
LPVRNFAKAFLERVWKIHNSLQFFQKLSFGFTKQIYSENQNIKRRFKMSNYQTIFNKKTIIILNLLIIFLIFGVSQTFAQKGGITISPPRMEVVVPAGTEKTVAINIDYNSDDPMEKLPIARIVARLEDWTLQPDGEIKFAPVGTLERSAKPFVTYSPAEFALDDKNGRQPVRLTFNVPKETPPGDYLLACYFEGRDNPPPPKKGEAQLYVRFRYYSLIYVMVPGLSREGELAGLKMNVENGLPIITPKMENKGNSRIRPKHSVEIRDTKDNVVFASPMSDANVILGGKSWEKSYPIDAALPSGDYTLSYTADFGDYTALRKAKVNFKITDNDVALRQTKSKKDSNLPVVGEKREVKSMPETTVPKATNSVVESKTDSSTEFTKPVSIKKPQ